MNPTEWRCSYCGALQSTAPTFDPVGWSCAHCGSIAITMIATRANGECRYCGALPEEAGGPFWMGSGEPPPGVSAWPACMDVIACTDRIGRKAATPDGGPCRGHAEHDFGPWEQINPGAAVRDCRRCGGYIVLATDSPFTLPKRDAAPVIVPGRRRRWWQRGPLRRRRWTR